MSILAKDGNLLLGGVLAKTLAQEYGTPLYVLEEDKILATMKEFVDALKKHFDGNGLICFASKAFCCKEIFRICKRCGLGVDVISQGELYAAITAGTEEKNILMHGSNKSFAELEYAVEKNISRIVVDNFAELETLNSIASRRNIVVNVLLRIKPGVEAHTHEYIRTGQIDSKFGFALETGEAFEAVKKSFGLKNILLLGLHCHIGSQIYSIEPYKLATKVMIEFLADIKQKTGQELKELNLGGGFGVAYLPHDTHISINEFLQQISATAKQVCKEQCLKMPFFMFEPGRSIVAEAGTTLYTVGAIKHIPNCRTYLSVDGGIADNPRFALYRAKYNFDIVSEMDKEKDKLYTVVGKCCESGDMLGKDVYLQQAKEKDILAVHCTGAYNYSMSSNYNGLPRPAVVMVAKGKSRIIVKGQKHEDLYANDI